MRESRTYGSVRGACDETHVPTATAARVHHAARRRGGVAARGAGAAGRARAAHRRAHRGGGRCGSQTASRRSCRDCSSWVGPRAAMCRSTSAGARAMPTAFASTRRNWSRWRLTSSWPLARRPWGRCMQATRTVPIVFATVIDPVGAGFVESLARPGGNTTGFMQFEYGLSGEMAGTAQADRAGRDTQRRSFGILPIAAGIGQFARHPGRGAVAWGWS